ncbi:MAG TPA: FoF1 ATP synthase subunit gamma [Candidatus Sulfotelmatobacter sp.]|nr:FoF1 ATP synthase subunit gamma [Candidatus Sulfotelmatobacter sp.]
MSLLQLRTRLKTIKSLESIFSALEVVTAVRAKRIRSQYQPMEMYLQPLRRVLAGRVAEKRTGQKVLVVITSNRGLCGAFNYSVVAKAKEFIGREPKAKLALIGRFGQSHLGRSAPVIAAETEIMEKGGFAAAAKFFGRIFSPDAEITVAYNSYRSAIFQVPQLYRLWPVPEELAKKRGPAGYIFEPDERQVTAELQRHYLEVRFFQLLLDSQMGELSARLMVLKGAIDTAKKITDKLFLQINKARQASITKDLLEIVSAAEALRREDE